MKKYLLLLLSVLFMVGCIHKDMKVSEHKKNIEVLEIMGVESVFWATQDSSSYFNILEVFVDKGRSYAVIDKDENLVVYRFDKKGKSTIEEFRTSPKVLQNGSYLYKRLRDTYPNQDYYYFNHKWMVYNGNTLKIVRFYTTSDDISSVVELTNHLARSDPTISQ